MQSDACQLRLNNSRFRALQAVCLFSFEYALTPCDTNLPYDWLLWWLALLNLWQPTSYNDIAPHTALYIGYILKLNSIKLHDFTLGGWYFLHNFHTLTSFFCNYFNSFSVDIASWLGSPSFCYLKIQLWKLRNFLNEDCYYIKKRWNWIVCDIFHGFSISLKSSGQKKNNIKKNNYCLKQNGLVDWSLQY